MLSRISGLIVLIGLLTGSLQVATAQNFSFSIGHGHHHGWHHGWHPHHCWHDPWLWGPHVDYVYVAPRPRVVYVQPPAQEVRVEAAVATGQPQWSPAKSKLSSNTADRTSTLQIWNRGGRRIPVAFLVDSQEVELFDGQSHSLHGGGTRVVEFDRGGTFGVTRYGLNGGEYEFVIADRGWDLVPKRRAASAISSQPLVKKNILPNDAVAR